MWVSNKLWQSTILRDIYKSPLSVRWVSGEIRKGLAASRWPVVEGFYSNRQDIEAMSADRLWQQRICWNSHGETICVWTPQGGDRGKRQMLKKCKRKKESTGTWKHCLFVLWVCLFVIFVPEWTDDNSKDDDKFVETDIWLKPLMKNLREEKVRRNVFLVFVESLWLVILVECQHSLRLLANQFLFFYFM